MSKNKVKDFLYEKESYLIRGACFEVWKAFAGIFKEKIVERALGKELKKHGLRVDVQKRLNISYKGEHVGTYTQDFVVEDKIIIELKAKPFITKQDKIQFWNYLKGSSYKLGFLINFGNDNLDIIRKVYDTARNKYKRYNQGSAINRCTFRWVSAKGVTLIELLLVIAIIAIISASAYPMGSSFLARNHLRNKTNEVVSTIRTAQLNAVSGKEGSEWGVKTTSNEIILYKGTDYSTRDNPALDQTFLIPSSVSVTQVEIYFNKLTGNPNSTATISVSNNIGGSRTVTINEVGIVDVN